MKRGVAQISDSVISIGLFLVFFAAIIVPVTNWALDQARATVAASQAKRVQQATNLYIKDNHDTIAATATSTNAFVFGVNELIAAGYLPAGFSTQNNFSATYQTRVFQPTTNKLSSMTYLSGGASISKSLARKIAIGIGADGGIIEGNVAQGALGNWTMNLADFGGFNPGDGSVVIAGFFDNGLLINDYLYRKAVPGHPELNTMSTTLNMGNNDVANAATTTTTTLNATNVNSQTTRTAGETYTGGWFRTTGDSGWYSEKWGGGFNMTDSTWIRAYNNKSIYTAGTVRAGAIQSDGNVSAAGVLELGQVNIVGTVCPSNGALSHDAAGATLSCQSGVWKSTSLGAGVLAYGNSACGEHGVSRAVCPNGLHLISGGWTLSAWSGNDGRNAPDASLPFSDTTWQIVTGGGNTGGQCLMAVAYCAGH